ncbi:MAG: hypothetical protein WDN69_08000 [Aliidongia sp.]
MSYFKHAFLAAAGITCILSLPALADDKVMVISPKGQMSSMAMPDKAMMDSMMKHATPMNDDMAILVWGTKTYMVKNEKMPDGKMTFDVWGIKFER